MNTDGFPLIPQHGATGKGAERALLILEAARHLYATAGYAGFSMRAVAAAVGISLGNLQHYLPSKDELIAAVLTYMMDSYQVEIDQAETTQSERNGPRRFAAAVDVLLQKIQEPDTQNVFIETWALATRNPSASQIMARTHRREQLAIYNLLRELPGAMSRRQAQERAQMVVLVIHGCLIRLSQSRMDGDGHASERERASTGLLNAVRTQILGIAGVA